MQIIDVNDVMEYNEGYKALYLQKIKQNVLVLRILFVLAQKAKGFQDLYHLLDHLKTGDKVYVINRDKNISSIYYW